MSQIASETRHHPIVEKHLQKRRRDVQLRVADAITAFAGSMTFVYLHAVAFAVWMLVFEKSPWPTLSRCIRATRCRGR